MVVLPENFENMKWRYYYGAGNDKWIVSSGDDRTKLEFYKQKTASDMTDYLNENTHPDESSFIHAFKQEFRDVITALGHEVRKNGGVLTGEPVGTLMTKADLLERVASVWGFELPS